MRLVLKEFTLAIDEGGVGKCEAGNALGQVKVCRKKCLSPLDWLWVWKFHAQVDVMVSDGLLFVLDNC